ncbi:hypothetical protein O6H91_01G088600 [Diphasiastrum complanatum]|uniref:Uncharacterized protein n=1 Tax=Diphasiastrum complanatum TaxID=34168 RepID=A0ACC2ET68_DIPCM|nr:hypothetical protein O6H91_01G088600 [Diphasiastrum complanatum]
MSRYHGKTRQSFDSEGTSFGASPPQSPRHPVYFVQSPSRESSHDGEKRSFQSTPVISPTASPIHQSFMKIAPDENGQSTASHPKPGSRRILPQPCYGGANASQTSKKKGYRKWTPSTIIEEEEQQSGFEKKRGLPRWVMFGLSLLCCILIFLAGALIFWLVCQPHSPHVEVKDIVFNEFEVVPGTDEGVPTSVLSANCTIILSFLNPSKYFGIHVSPSDINMIYQELPIGKGQAKESKRNLPISVTADKLPLFGAGPSLQSITSGGGGVPLEIQGSLQSYAYVFSKVVKPRFSSFFSCDILISSSGVNFLKLLQKSCSYSHSK